MNPEIEAFARRRIKEDLALLPEGWQMKFKRMYAFGNLETPINVVVDEMPADKLDWAMQQVQNSTKKLCKTPSA